MGTRYNIAITATDAATARVQAIKKSLRSITSPIREVGRSVNSLGKEVGVDKIAKGVGTLGRVAAGAVRSIGGLGGAIGGLAGASALTAFASYTREVLYGQSATLRLSAVSGVAAGKLQTMEGAAKLAGLEAGDMDSALLSLGTTLQDARWGRNQGALLMMNRLGMKLRTTKEGAIDTVASLGDLAEILGPGGKLGKAPVQTKALVAQQFGAEALLPILIKGRKALEDYAAASAKIKPPVSDEDLKAADEYRQKIDKLSLSFSNLGNSITEASRGTIGAIADWVAAHNTRAAENVKKEGFFGAIGIGTYKALTGDFGQYRKPKHVDPRLEQESIDDFKRMGWSDAQAKGLVANLIEESGIDPRAVGDNGQAKGALQWHPDRQRNYAAFAASRRDIQGKSIESSSLADQRKFIDFELRHGTEQAAGKRIMAQTDAGSAAMVASQAYVRPAGGLSTAAQRGRTAVALDKALPSTGLTPSPAQDDRGATALAGLWKNQADKKSAPSETTVTLKIQAPPGTKADVVDSKGPVQTVLKVDYSMPDFSL